MLAKTEGKWRRGQQRMRWLDNITNWMDMNLSKLQAIVKDTGETQYPRFFPFEVILEPQEQCWVWLLLLSCLVVSDSLDPHGLHHARLPCPSPSPRAYSDSCPLSQWCHPTILSSSLFTFNLSQHQSQFFNESGLHIRWPKYWSFSIRPSNEYSGLISFIIDWFDLLAVQGTQEEPSPTPQFKSINSSALSLPYGPTLISIQNY